MTKLPVSTLSVGPFYFSPLLKKNNLQIINKNEVSFLCLDLKVKNCCGSRANWIQKRRVTAEKMPVKSLKGQRLGFFFGKSNEIMHLVYFMCHSDVFCCAGTSTGLILNLNKLS